MPTTGIRLGDAARLRDGALERFVVGGEVAERAVLIPLRDVRVGETLVADLIAPAVAAHDAPAAVVFDRFPAGVVAKRARHRWQVKRHKVKFSESLYAPKLRAQCTLSLRDF